MARAEDFPFGSSVPFGGGNPPFQTNGPGFDIAPRVTSVNPNSGRIGGGAAVTVTGANFRPNLDGTAPSVKFGGFAATSVVVVSSTSITCVTPAVTAVGLVDVTVTIGSQTGTLASSFTYYSSEILSISPSHGTFNGGTSVVVNGFNFIAGSSISFGGTAATGVTFVDEEHYICVTPNHAAGYADVTITEPGGATNTLRNAFKFTLLTRGEDIRRMPGITVRDVLNNAPNSCSFAIDGDSNIPEVGEEIEITDEEDGNRVLFRGNVQSVEQAWEGQTDQLVWHVNAVDFTFLLNKYRPVGEWKDQSVSNIVKDMISRFAPGFTSTKVQTNLAKASARFDGSQDFSTCLNALAQVIGGGHWYVDYDQVMHFFHVVPDDLIIPDLPQSVIHLGPGNAMVVSEGAAIATTFAFDIGFYMFRSTFVYDNGLESAMSPYSNLVALQGTNQISFTNLATGVAAGTHTVVARRIYYRMWGPGTFVDLEKFVQINDNTTTAFTTYFGAQGASVATAIAISDDVSVPTASLVAPPAGPAVTPSAAVGTASIFIPQYPPLVGEHAVATFTPGAWAFKVSLIYRDGTESLPSPASNPVVLTGLASAYITNIGVGPTINSVDVIGRKIYASSGVVTTSKKSLAQVVADLTAAKAAGTLVAQYGGIIGVDDAKALQAMNAIPSTFDSLAAIIGGSDLEALMSSTTTIAIPDWSPDKVKMWYLLNDNSTTTADIGPGMGDGVPQTASSTVDVPMWPNPDGPSLENSDPPADLDDVNTDLLMEPQFTSTEDLSQIRNRVYVRGAGTATTKASAIGSKVLTVQECGILSRNGGTVQVGLQQLRYIGLSAPSGPGTVKLKKALTVYVDIGEAVNLFFQADDIASQRSLAKIELDKDGAPTDGVHEYVIVDTSLISPFQLYMRAYAELENFGRPITTIRYATRDPKSRSGQIIHVDLTNPPCTGDFLIQDVTIDQIHDESDQLLPRYLVTASSVKFDLSDLLLQIIAGHVGDTGTSFAGVSLSSASDLGVRTVQVYLSNAVIKTLSSSPVLAIPAPGVGKIIMVLFFVAKAHIDTAYSVSNGLRLRYSGTSATATMIGVNGANSIPGAGGTDRWVKMPLTDFAMNVLPGAGPNGVDLDNLPVYIDLPADVTSGSVLNTVKVTICYMVIDNPDLQTA